MEFFAFGGSGYSTLQEFMILDEFIDLIKPHIIILQLCTNDIFDNSYALEKVSSYNIGQTRPYMDLQGTIFYENSANWPYVVSILTTHSRFIRFVATKTRRLVQKISGPGDFVETEINREGNRHQGIRDSLAITKKIMDKIRNRASNSVIIAFCADEKKPYYSELKKTALSADFKFIDGIAETVKDHEQQGFTVRAGDKYHWNELGHKIVADQIMIFGLAMVTCNPSDHRALYRVCIQGQ